MNQSDLAIIIPSLHPDYHELSRRALGFCLPELEETFQGRIVVSYNGDGSHLPQGQCKSVNDAASRADTKWLMVMNNDMVAPPGWFEEMFHWIEKLGLLVASPNLMEPRKGAPPFIEKFCGGLGTEGTEPDFNKQCFLDFVENYNPVEQSSYDGKIPVEDGFNLPFIIRKDVFDTVGGYDTKYDPFSSNSDSDLQYKLMYAGITPKRIKSVLFYHFSQTSGTFHPSNEAYVQNNHRYFTEKWGVERASSPSIWFKPDVQWDEVTFSEPWRDKYE